MKTVVVIENNAGTRTALHNLLKLRWPHLTVFTAENGPEGLQLAHMKRPDLILLDGELPGLDGYQTAKVLRHLPETSAIPLIGLTTDHKATGLQTACDAFLVKPFSTDTLLNVITTLNTNGRVQTLSG
ncbi:MAG: response regulator [Chloroflexi bacterium]|nr:response regulator [Chloroflexota bacterium]